MKPAGDDPETDTAPPATTTEEPAISTRRREDEAPSITGDEMSVPSAGRLAAPRGDASSPPSSRQPSDRETSRDGPARDTGRPARLAGMILPPLGVYQRHGVGARFWLNCLLTLAGYLPGLAHRLWLGRRSRHPDPSREDAPGQPGSR